MGKAFRFHTNSRGAVRGYVPDDYDASYTVIYVHGYGVSVDEAWTKHKLIEQYQASGLKGLFLAVEAPANAQQHVFNPDIPSLLNDVKEQAGVVAPAKVVAVGHSGAYRTLIHWTDYPNLKQILLLDGLFGGIEPFAKYVNGGGKMVVVATERTSSNSAILLKKAPIDYTRVTDDHMALVTSGRYIPVLLRRSVAGGVPVGFFLILIGLGLLFLR